MKYALALVAALAIAGTAQAKLTPYQASTDFVLAEPDVMSLYTGPAGAQVERGYFQAPPPPQAARAAERCTVQIFVFTKARLAQACY